MKIGTRRLLVASVVAACVGVTTMASGEEDVASLYRESYRLEANRNSSEALAKMRQIQSKAGSSYFVSVRMAWLSYLTGDHDAAIQHYRAAITAAPKAIEPKLGVTLPLLAKSQWRDLERACRDVLAADPNNGIARARLAHALYMVGNYPDSATVYRKLVDDFPAELDHQTGLGWALLKMGRRNEAHGMFRAVLAVSPDNPNAQAGLSAK